MKGEKNTDILVVESAYLHQAIGIPGTKLGMEKTLNAIKQPGIKLGWSQKIGGLVIRLQGKTAIGPAANVASALLEMAEDGEA